MVITVMEGREGERPNSYDLRGHGNSLLELQHLVFMLHNASGSKVTYFVHETVVRKEKVNAEPGLYSRASSVQRTSAQGSDCLGGGFCGEKSLYLQSFTVLPGRR